MYLEKNPSMIRLLSKLRRMNLKNRNFIRYAQYAIGEVILIIIGILIALSVNEWSIKKEKQEAFNTALSQVYVYLQKELDWYELMIASYKRQSVLAELELNEKDVPFNPGKMIGYLNSIAQGQRDLLNEPLLLRLNENITSEKQSRLVNDISTYYTTWQNWYRIIEDFQIRFLSDLIKEYDLPFIENYMLFYTRPFQDTEYEFTDEEIQKAQELRSDKVYKTKIKSILHRNQDLIARYQFRNGQIRNVMEVIREYDPRIRITYDRIGLVGSATKHGWDSTIPMHLVDPAKRIWSIRIQLNKGEIKFRDGDAWEDNWGANYVPDGTLMGSGDNIPVEQGTYEVQLNMIEKTYLLKRIENAND